MDYLSYFFCILFSCSVLHYLLSNTTKSAKKRLPPGPIPLPIVGNLFKLGNRPHESMADLAKIHGPVMSLKLGNLKTVVVSSASMVKEVLQRNDALFCNRAVPHSLTALQHHDFSIVFLPASPQWRSYRKILNSNVFSSSRLDSIASQNLRKRKLEDLIEYLKSCSLNRVSVDIGQDAFSTTINLLSNTFFSVDLVDLKSTNSHEFKELVLQIMVEAGTPNLSDYFTLLRRFDPQGIRRRMGVHFEKMINLFTGMIQQRLMKKDSFDECSDALDSMLHIQWRIQDFDPVGAKSKVRKSSSRLRREKKFRQKNLVVVEPKWGESLQSAGGGRDFTAM